MRRPELFAFLLAAFGCGRIHFAPAGGQDGSGSDALVGDGQLGDGQAFSDPVRLPELSSPVRDDEPSLTDDMLELYFVSNRSPSAQLDLWWSSRPSTSAAFGQPMLVPGVNSAMDDVTPRITGDGLTLILASNRTTSISVDLWLTTRPTRLDPWAAPGRIVDLSSSFQDAAGSLSPSGLEIIYSAQVVGLGFDLFESSRTSVAASWDPAVAVDSLNTSAEEFAPFLVDQGLEIYFSSNRDGDPDLYVARRPTRGMPFSTPTTLVELSGPAGSNDNYPWVSPDRHTIYFSRDEEIYVATR